MLEVYSKNVTVAPNSAIPLNTIAFVRGCAEKLSGAATIQFLRSGAYSVKVTCSAVASAAGDISIQLYKNGVAQPQAAQTVTAADTTSSYSLSLDTIVSVSQNGCKCCGNDSTNVTIVNTSDADVIFDIDVVVGS